MGEALKIIEDLKKVGVNVIKSPMGYYTIMTRRFESEGEIIKEVQRILINHDYTIMSVKSISDFMKKNMELQRGKK